MAHELSIGFVGNPNCGKTTLFNAYTGANLKVANWPGVTVEKKEGLFQFHDHEYKLVDLPGTYSLTSYTMEEQVTRQYILSDDVDVIIDVADASSLERNLYLTLQLIELGKPVILALNMMDIVQKRGMEIDLHRLPEMLGIPVIPVSARRKTGLDILMHAAAHHKDQKATEATSHHHTEQTRHRHDHHEEYVMVYSDALEDKIDLLIEALKRKYPDLDNLRWHAIKLLENDTEITRDYPVDLPDVLDRSYEKDIINQKYDFIDEVIQEVLVNKSAKEALTDKADQLLTHRIWGPAHLPVHHGAGVLSHLYGGRLAEGLLPAGAGRHLRRGGRWAGGPPCGAPAQLPDCRRHYRRRRRHFAVFAQHLHPVSGFGLFGGQRIHVPGGLCDGQHYGQAGAFRPVLYPHDPGLWLHGTRHYGFPCPGEQA